MKTVYEYIQEKMNDDMLKNNSQRIKEKTDVIKEKIDETIFSIKTWDLICHGDELVGVFVELSPLFLAISVPATKKMRKDSIIEALKSFTHFHIGNYSGEEYIDLLSNIAEEIMNYSVITGNQNKYSKGSKIIISLGKKALKTIYKPIVNTFKAPANVLMMKWIFAGVRQALILYLVNRDILENVHSVAVEEACKGYEKLLSNRFLGDILIVGELWN